MGIAGIIAFGIKLRFDCLGEEEENRKQMNTLVTKIDQQSETIKQLHDIIMSDFVGKQKEDPDVYEKAKKLYNAGMVFSNQGRDREAGEAFLGLKKIAIDQKNYTVAAEASIIAAWRFEDAGEKTKSANLKEDAGNLYMKVYEIDGLDVRIEQARNWKRQAAEMYQNEGLENKAIQLYKSIELLNKGKMQKKINPILKNR